MALLGCEFGNNADRIQPLIKKEDIRYKSGNMYLDIIQNKKKAVTTGNIAIHVIKK
jgi:hypothetical protein